MSESRGAFISVSGSSLSSVAGISARQAFLAPAIGIRPESSAPPVTMIESMPASAFLVPRRAFDRRLILCARLPRLRLRLAPRDIRLQRRLEPFVATLAGPGFRGLPVHAALSTW